MSLLTGAQCANVRAAASGYLLNGASVIPLIGKKAVGRWQQYQERRMTWAEFARVPVWQNVGIICGEVSENLLVIDLDGREAVMTFIARWPELLQTMAIRTGRGYHLYYHTDTLPKNMRVNGIELRGNGCYVVAPPSVHPDTQQPYTVHKQLPPMRADLAGVAAWLEGLRGGETVAKAKPELPTIGETGYLDAKGRPIRNGAAYARWSLNDEAGRVQAARVGNRAAALNTAAFRMGQLAARGWVSYSTVEQMLLAASCAWSDADLNEQARAKMIRAGFESGAGKMTDRD